MILNYDKNKEGNKFSFLGIVDEIKGLFDKKPDISKEISDLFKSIDPNKTISDLRKDGVFKNVTDTDFNDWLSDVEGDAISAADAFDQYQQALVAAGKTTSGFGQLLTGLKNIGGSLIATFANFATVYYLEVIAIHIEYSDKFI